MHDFRLYRRHFALFCVLLMLSFVPLELVGTAKSSGYGQSDYIQLVIRFKEPISLGQIQAISDYYGQIVDRNDFLNSVLVKVPKETVSLLIEGLQQGNLVDYIERNTVNEMEYVPNDEYWSLQWNMPTIKANASWDVATGSNSVIVAVIDSGIDYNHPDLASNYLPGGYDWSDNDTDPSAYDHHGTFCAGIIAAVTNNTIGVAGVAQVKILSEKIFGYGANNGTDWALAQAFIHATNLGAKIISCSVAGPNTQTKYDAVKYAYDHGVLIVAAAGNKNTNITTNCYPAAYSEVVSVAATNVTDQKAWYSNWGNWIELSAPGGDEGNPIFSTMANSSYGYMTGTSMACPHVAGVAALIWSRFSNYSRDEVRYLLRSSSDDLGVPGKDQYFGYGRVNAYRAIQGLIVPITTVSWAGQNIDLRDVAWKPDMSYGLIVGRSGTVLKYDGYDFKVLTSNLGYEAYDVTWKPDGSYALIVGLGGKCTKYDGTNFTNITTPVTYNLWQVKWRNDSSYALFAGDNGTLLKYDGTTFSSVNTYTTANLESLDWNNLNTKAMIVGTSGALLQYDHATGMVHWLGESLTLQDIAWNPNATYGLILGYGGLCIGYDGSEFTVINTTLGFAPLSVDWRPNGLEATIVGVQGHVTEYFYPNTFISVTSPITNDLRAVSWRADNSYAVIAGASGTLLLFNGVSLATLQSLTASNLNEIGWYKTSQKALIVGDSGTILMLDASTMPPKLYWFGQNIALNEIAWKPNDNAYGLIVGYGGIILKYDGTKFERLISGLTSAISDVAWKPDGSYAVLIGPEGLAVKYDGSAFSSLSTGTISNLNEISWKSDGSLALVAGDSGTLLKFDGASFEPIILKILSPPALVSIAWHPNGTYAIITGQNGLTLKYIVENNEICWLGYANGLDTIAWKPGGSYGLLVGQTGTVMEYDGQDFRILITGLASHLWDVAWNPTGTEALIAGDEGILVSFDGTSFLSVASNITTNLYGIGWNPTGEYALIVGAQGVLLKYQGGIITALNSTTQYDLNAVTWNSTHALIVGSSGTALSWNGTELKLFNSTATGTTSTLWDAGWKPGGNYSLIISQNGQFLKFDGQIFTKLSTGNSNDFYSSRCSLKWRPDGSYALVTGTYSTSPSFWRYDGSSWTRYGVRTIPWGLCCQENTNNSILVGDTGEVIRYDGVSISYLSSTTSKTLWDADWRPDGSYALIIAQSGEYLKFDGEKFTHLSTGSSADFYSSYPCRVEWKPDGSYAAVLGMYSSSPSLYIYDGSAFTRYGLRAQPLGLNWRDGAYVSIVGTVGEVARYDGVSISYLSSTTANTLWDTDWKPDGSYALIIAQSGEYLKFDGEKFTHLNTGSSADFYSSYPCKVEWKPDGSYAAIIGMYSSSPSLYIYDGAVLTRTVLRAQPLGLSWKDGAYVSIVGTIGEVARYDGISISYLSATTANTLWDVDWKPDGSYPLIIAQNGEALKFNGQVFSYASTGSTADFYSERCNIEWHPSSLYALITGRSSSSPYYYVYRYDGAAFSRIDIRRYPAAANGPMAYGLDWRQDGAYCLIVGTTGMVLEYDGLKLYFLSSSTGNTLWDADWKPDSSYALVVSQGGEVLKFDGHIFYTDGGADFAGAYRCSVDWSSNGVWSVITGRFASSPYYAVWQYDGATFLKFTVNTMPEGVAFHPSQQYCLIVGDSGNAWTFDSITLTPLVTGATKNLYDVAWKPDGSYAIIIGQGGTALKYDGLWFTPLSTGVTQDLKGIAWSRDGSYALIVGAQGMVLKFNGTNFMPLNSGVSEDLVSVDFGPNLALIIGKVGRLLKFENDNMYPIDLETTLDLQGINWSPRGDTAVVTSSNGIIWKIYFGPPLTVSAKADPAEIKSGEKTTITVSVYNGTIPVSGAKLFIDSSRHGVFSSVVDLGNGNYTFNYTAPEVESATVDRISITALCAGFAPGSSFVDLSLKPAVPTFPNLVVRGSNNLIYYRTYNVTASSWAGWNVLPGATCDSPAATVCGNELHIVVRGMDGNTLWHGNVDLSTNAFSGWTLLSGSTPSAPTLTANSTHLSLVVRGQNNLIYYRFYDCASHTWTGWYALPSGSTCDGPAATMLANNLHIVVRGMDGYTLWHSSVDLSTQAFSGWQLVGGATESRPTLTACKSRNEVILVVRGLNNVIYRNTWTGSGWTGWAGLPTGSTCDGVGATVIGETLHVVVRGMDGYTLWHGNVDLASSAFSGWTLLDGSTPSPPTLTS